MPAYQHSLPAPVLPAVMPTHNEHLAGSPVSTQAPLQWLQLLMQELVYPTLERNNAYKWAVCGHLPLSVGE